MIHFTKLQSCPGGYFAINWPYSDAGPRHFNLMMMTTVTNFHKSNQLLVSYFPREFERKNEVLRNKQLLALYKSKRDSYKKDREFLHIVVISYVVNVSNGRWSQVAVGQ